MWWYGGKFVQKKVWMCIWVVNVLPSGSERSTLHKIKTTPRLLIFPGHTIIAPPRQHLDSSSFPSSSTSFSPLCCFFLLRKPPEGSKLFRLNILGHPFLHVLPFTRSPDTALSAWSGANSKIKAPTCRTSSALKGHKCAGQENQKEIMLVHLKKKHI